MQGTHAIIASDEGDKEYLSRKMTLDQSENAMIPNGIRVHKDEVIGEHRIVEMLRPRKLKYFAFREQQRTISIIHCSVSSMLSRDPTESTGIPMQYFHRWNIQYAAC